MPYHLVDMHFRVTVAENLSFVFLPLILLAVKKNIEIGSKKWFIILPISLGLLILSHQAISVMFLPIVVAYCLFVWIRKKNRNIKSLSLCFISLTLGFLISSFYWMPIIFLAKFTQQGGTPIYISFPTITELLYSPWRLGFLFQGSKGELSYLIGYTQLLIIIISIYLYFKSRLDEKLNNYLGFFLVISSIIFFMLLSISKPIWEITPLLKYSQFSTRLLVPLSLCISILAGGVAKKINRTWFIIGLCFLTISYTILNWGNRRAIPAVNDAYLRQDFIRNPDVGTLEPTSPIWADLNISKLRTKPKSDIEIISGNADISEISRTPIRHDYIINAKTIVQIKENTLFFPGWIVLANDKEIPINYNNPEFPGVISFTLNKGIYNTNVQFMDLPIIVISKWISILSILGVLIFMFTPDKFRLSSKCTEFRRNG
jgi:hypothetical protein